MATNHEILRQLRDAIVDAFTANQLKAIVNLGFGIEPEVITSWDIDLPQIAWSVIRYFERQDQIGELMFQLLLANPQNEKIQSVFNRNLRLREDNITVNGRSDDYDEIIKMLRKVCNDIAACKENLDRMVGVLPQPWSRTDWLLFAIFATLVVGVAIILVVAV